MLAIAALVLALGINPAEAARKKKHTYQPQPDRFAAIVIDASTGYVISEKNPDKRLFPASLTKMMTLYLAFEAMSQGTLNKNQYIPVSRRAASQEPSSLGLKPGDSIRVENAILGIATKSANDCAVTLAEAIGGSEDRFARAMTAKARQLGMNNTHFVNASGLHNRSQFSSARDMATLSQALIRDYPRYYRYFSTASFTYEGNTYFNHNKLMSSYQGMDGLKTGYVYASGFNLASSAVRDGTRLIGVVFGGKTARVRNQVMKKLLDNSFARISNIRVASLGETGENKTLPVRKPAAFQKAVEVSVDNAGAGAGATFNAADLVMDQGDAAINEDGKTARIIYGKPPVDRSGALQTASASPQAKGSWAIQIGTFSSRDAGIHALKIAKTSLQGVVNGVDTIAPLMTNRGMIYRAKLLGLARNDAAQACRILKGGCLVLAVE
ncbi:MAG: D-alanyl-D-alanine carboxypeptidase [Alphaproteobacteria bacterium]|nr:D-alanyl-D-alanine carboxypeptidase [Alphaproteobacteria bacterium]